MLYGFGHAASALWDATDIPLTPRSHNLARIFLMTHPSTGKFSRQTPAASLGCTTSLQTRLNLTQYPVCCRHDLVFGECGLGGLDGGR